MNPAKRKQIDPLEKVIEAALSPGCFISYNAAWSFVEDVQGVANDIGKIIRKEPARAARLYESFIAACHEKAEEIDDSSGDFGTLVEDLLLSWIKARQAANLDPNETARSLLSWMEDDPYLGYVLRVEGTIGDEPSEIRTIAVGKGAQAKHQFRVGMEVSGLAVPVADPRLEVAGYYKTSGLKILKYAEGDPPAGPPFHGVPLDLETYRSRGHRRLDTRTYDAKCTTCIWGCRMPVEMIINH